MSVFADLASIQSDLIRETWKTPRQSRLTLSEFGRTSIVQRSIKPSTHERYGSA